MEFKGLSLFANVGIAETRLKDLGLEVAVVNELLPERAKFHNEMHGADTVTGDITDPEKYSQIIQKAKAAGVNFILATPPCQGMSVAGHMKDDDPRNVLIVKAMDALRDLTPEFMLVENVPQMLNTFIKVDGEKVKITDYVKKVCDELGYEVKFAVFDAADYGTPQYRKRSFTRIYKKEYEWSDPIKEKQITVRDAIGDLPSLEAGQSSGLKWHEAKKHNDNHVLWMRHTPTGATAFDNEKHYPQKDGRRIKGFSTTYKRISWDRPAPTITMGNGSVSSQNNVHPGRKLDDGTYSDARVLTLLEIFRLTGLPDDWNPPAWAKEPLIRKVIGEAIPPNLVKAVFAGLSVLNKRA